jgi:hypothetical protein
MKGLDCIMTRPLFLRAGLMLFVLCMFMTGIQNAYGLEVRDIPPLENTEKISDEAFLMLTREIESDPDQDPNLAFKMRIPKDWQSSDDVGLRNFMLSSKVFGEIARYFSPPSLDLRSSLSVSAMEMDQRIKAKNWFLHYVFTQGYTLEGMRVDSDDKVFAQYVLIEDDVPYTVHAVAISSGRRVIIAQYYVPYALMDRNDGLHKRVMESFELINPNDNDAMIFDTYTFLDFVKFDYPSNWELRTPQIRDIERMDATLINILNDQQMNGKISVSLLSHAIPNLNINEEVKKAHTAFIETTNFELGDMVETIDTYNFHESVESGVVEVYNLYPQNNFVGYEYWFAFLNDQDYYYYVITMVTPARSADFYVWAQNIEIFQFIVESIRPGESY